MLRSKLLFFVLLSLALMALAGCGGGGATNELAPDQSALLYGKDNLDKEVRATPPVDTDPDWTWDLIAGQHMLAGTVAVWNTPTTCYVVYTLTGDWLMTEAHVLVSTEQPGPKDGVPGRFPYKMEFDPPVASYTFEIPLSGIAGLDCKDKLYIATHAATTNGETIWGGDWDGAAGAGTWDFGWKKWGGGFTTNVMPTYELPASIRYYGTHFGAVSYWNVFFEGNPQFDFPGSNHWIGWCADKYNTMYPSRYYSVTMVSTYDMSQTKVTSDLTDRMHSDNWDLINYMINQRHLGQGDYNVNWNSNTNKQYFQDAIWYLKDGVEPASGSYAWNFINDAMANGENYIPAAGDWFALILYPAGASQMNIIEVDP